jgi:hypothetical protein
MIEINTSPRDMVHIKRLSKLDIGSAWRHDGFFKLEEEAHITKRRPKFKEMGMPFEEKVSVMIELDAKAGKPDQPRITSGMREEKINYHSREFIRPDDRSTKWDFTDYMSTG